MKDIQTSPEEEEVTSKKEQRQDIVAEDVQGQSSDESVTEFVMVEAGDEGTVDQQQTAFGEDEHPPEKGVWSGGEELDALVSMEAGAAQERLVKEAELLERERTRQSRAAAAVSNQMYKDAQVRIILPIPGFQASQGPPKF